MVKPTKLLKFFQFIKFPLSQTSGQNYSKMPIVCKDVLAIGQEHQFNLLSQSDMNLCAHYGSTHLCKGQDVLITDFNTTCIGAYYLEDLTFIRQKCKFNLFQAQEHIFSNRANQWIILSPIDFPTTLNCP